MSEWLNQGPATVTGGHFQFLFDPANSSVSIRGRVAPVPTPTFDFQVSLASLTKQVTNGFGILVMDSASGKLVTYLWQTETSPEGIISYVNYIAKWSDPDTYVPDPYGKISWPGNPPKRLRAQFDGSNVTFSFGEDNSHWLPSGVLVPVPDFLPAIDRVGWFVYSQNPLNPAGVTLLNSSLTL